MDPPEPDTHSLQGERVRQMPSTVPALQVELQIEQNLPQRFASLKLQYTCTGP